MPIDNSHRPWSAPQRPHAMAMSWASLLFIHWPVDVALLRPHIPAALSIDTFDGAAWLGVVPLRMCDVRARGTPALPWVSNFPELNVRTYVTIDGKPGVWFFSLDAHQWLAVQVARRTFHLNYCHARMSCMPDRSAGEVTFASRRTHRGLPSATFEARYKPQAPLARSLPGSIEYFLTERYCLYAASRAGALFRGEIAHVPWPLQAAEAEVRVNTMSEQLGFKLPDVKPLLHFSERLDVVAWRLDRVTSV